MGENSCRKILYDKHYYAGKTAKENPALKWENYLNNSQKNTCRWQKIHEENDYYHQSPGKCKSVLQIDVILHLLEWLLSRQKSIAGEDAYSGALSYTDMGM